MNMTLTRLTRDPQTPPRPLGVKQAGNAVCRIMRCWEGAIRVG